MIDLETIKQRDAARDRCHNYTGCEKNFDAFYLCAEHNNPDQAVSKFR